MSAVSAIIILSTTQTQAQSVTEPTITLVGNSLSLSEVFSAIQKQTGLQVIVPASLTADGVRLPVSFRAAPLSVVFEQLLHGRNMKYEIRQQYIAVFEAPRNLLTRPSTMPKDSASAPAPVVHNGAANRILDEVIVTGFQRVEKKKFTGAATRVEAADVKIDGMTDVSRMLEGRVAGVSVQNISGTFGTAPKIRIRGATSISGENKPLWVVDDVVLEDVVNISNDQLSSGDAGTLLGSPVAGLNLDDIESLTILKDAAATALYGARAMNGVIVITTKKGRPGKPQTSYSGYFTSMLKPSYSSFNLLNSADQMSVYSEMARKGWLTNAALAEKANTGVYGKMYNLINAYDSSAGQYGLPNTYEARNAFLQRYAGANTNWFNLLFSNSLTQEHAVNISAGNDFAQYYFSTSIYNDNGWALGNNVRRYTGNMRANFKMSDKIQLGFITTATVREQTTPGTNDRVTNVVAGSYDRDFEVNPYTYALNTSRTLTAYDEKGDLEYFNANFAPFNILHELNQNNNKTSLLDVKLQGELVYKINRHFTFNSNAVVRYVKSDREQLVTEYSNAAEAYRAAYNSVVKRANTLLYLDADDPDAIPEIILPKGGFYNRYENSLKNFNVRNQLTYSQTIATLHAVKVLAGQEIKLADRQEAFNKGFGFQYDRGAVPFTDYRIIKQMLERSRNYYGMQNWYDRFAAFFGQVNYMYDNRYVINGTMRYDGTNKLGASRQARWLPTWTIGAAWLPNANMKVRAGYGLTASMGDATNSTVLLSNGVTRRPRLAETETLIEITGLENSQLTWEKQYSGNLGVDLNLLNDKIALTADIYSRRSFDLISSLKTSGIGGQAYKIANYADMKSHGAELTVTAKQIQRKNWGWQTTFTAGYNKNKITNLANRPRIFDLVIPEGGALLNGPVRGLYSIQFSGLNPLNGMPNFISDKGTVSPGVYLQSNNVSWLKYEGPVDPVLTGGLSNRFNYKNWELSCLITYQTGNKIRLNPRFKSSYTDLDAMPYEFLNRWTLPGDEQVTNIPSILSQYEERALDSEYPYNNYNYSTERVADGSFVRLKSVVIRYTVPAEALKTIGIRNLSFSVTGANLCLLYADSKLKGQDPEFFTSGGVALPMPRQIAASLNIGL